METQKDVDPTYESLGHLQTKDLTEKEELAKQLDEEDDELPGYSKVVEGDSEMPGVGGLAGRKAALFGR